MRDHLPIVIASIVQQNKFDVDNLPGKSARGLKCGYRCNVAFPYKYKKIFKYVVIIDT